MCVTKGEEKVIHDSPLPLIIGPGGWSHCSFRTVIGVLGFVHHAEGGVLAD